MKIEHQVCTLEQAKRLSQLGIMQGLSIFFWSDYDGKVQLMLNFTPEDGYKPDAENTCFSAFTVAELGVMLPQTINFYKTQKASIKLSRFNAFTIYYNRHSSGSNVFMTESKHEAQARAAMLITLLENNIITAEEISQHLQIA